MRNVIVFAFVLCAVALVRTDEITVENGDKTEVQQVKILGEKVTPLGIFMHVKYLDGHDEWISKAIVKNVKIVDEPAAPKAPGDAAKSDKPLSAEETIIQKFLTTFRPDTDRKQFQAEADERSKARREAALEEEKTRAEEAKKAAAESEKKSKEAEAAIKKKQADQNAQNAMTDAMTKALEDARNQLKVNGTTGGAGGVVKGP